VKACDRDSAIRTDIAAWCVSCACFVWRVSSVCITRGSLEGSWASTPTSSSILPADKRVERQAVAHRMHYIAHKLPTMSGRTHSAQPCQQQYSTPPALSYWGGDLTGSIGSTVLLAPRDSYRPLLAVPPPPPPPKLPPPLPPPPLKGGRPLPPPSGAALAVAGSLSPAKGARAGSGWVGW
jgi:hypothetical protein